MWKDAVKAVVRVVSLPFVRYRPIATWPEWVARVHGVNVPASLPPHAQPVPTGGANINILTEMIERTKSLPGAIAECGVFQGASTIGMALYMRERGIQKQIYAFDSFAGFNSDSLARDLKLGALKADAWHEHDFSKTSLEAVKAKIRRFDIKIVELVPGYFSDSFSTFTKELQFCFVHLDVDLYDSYLECLNFFYPKVQRNGIILLDEYNDPPWPGCNKAVDEFLSTKPERLEVICRQNYQKWYFVKQ